MYAQEEEKFVPREQHAVSLPVVKKGAAPMTMQPVAQTRCIAAHMVSCLHYVLI